MHLHHNDQLRHGPFTSQDAQNLAHAPGEKVLSSTWLTSMVPGGFGQVTRLSAPLEKLTTKRRRDEILES